MLIDILNDLLYTVFKPNFECFRKVRCFANFFYEKGRPQASFCGIPYATDWPTNSSSSNMYRV